MDRLLKVATPLTAVTVAAPLSVPPLGLASMATVTEAVLPVTVLPKMSWTVTVTAGLMATVDTVLVGCRLKASLLAAAGVMLKLVLVTPVSPVLEAVSVYPVPAVLIDRLLNVATPLIAVVPTVPPRAPPPGLVPMPRLIEAVLLVTVLPRLSWTITWTPGLMLTPATVLLGCAV